MSGSTPAATRLVELVRTDVTELLADFAHLTADSKTADSTIGVPEFTQRLRDYVLRLGSMRRTRVAAHTLDNFRRTDEATVLALAHTCAALELFHAAALIHDDIIDESPTRRGNPAFHTGWGDTADRSPTSVSLGVTAGLLGGDAVLVLCARAIDRIASPVRERVSGFFQEIQLRTLVGELQDSMLEHRRIRHDRATITQMSVNKTAWYTVTAPMVLAARCANIEQQRTGALIGAGSAYGEAFQLLDDVNEVLTDAALTGKNPLDDLNSGKATLLHHIVATHATPAERAVLDRIYGRGNGSARDLERYRLLVTAHGQHICAELEALMNRARSHLRSVGFRDDTVGRIEDELNPHNPFPVTLYESA
ncbi:polyprenyl synthetase family protein [Nocardia callitridis]|uniref:Geranylgeranyl pyrophosphate synthase n=1 Tax=Nocardia callitridis TaxID=648753 RepID=A0ABP9K293_9NOCA